MSLRYRPPIWARVLVGLVGVAVVAANTALLLSDRAPRALRSMFGDLAVDISRRLDSDGRATAALDARDVGSDSIVHLGLWATATVVIGLAVWSWGGAAISAVVVGAVSLLVEVAQGRYSTTRNVEMRDAVFNLLGVAVGTVAVVGLYLVVEAVGSSVAAATGRVRRRD